MSLEDAIRAEGTERGYRTSAVTILHSKEPSINYRRGEGRVYAFDIADYFEDLPEDLAAELAAAIWDHVLGDMHGINAEIRRHVRFNHLDDYVRRNGLIEPREVQGYDLAEVVRELKIYGQLPQDMAAYWIPGEVALASPSFRLVGIPLALIEDPEEIPAELMTNAQIMERRSRP